MRTRLASALERIRASREMTERMVEDIHGDEWFWQPGEGMGHVAWHVGHLAFAQYFLCLKRQRDRTIEDESLITTKFLKRYKQGSVPTNDPQANFPVDEIRSTLAAVHERSLAELSERTDTKLLVPSPPQHPVFDTKLGAVEWCSQHEMMHCGQIALLRRLMGKPPRW